MKKTTDLISLLLIVIVLISAFSVCSVSATTDTYYSSELTELEQVIYGGYANMDETIDISSFSASYNDVQTAFTNIFNKRPELFHVEKIMNVVLSSNTVKSITPNYCYTADEVSVLQAQIDVAVNSLISDFTDDMTDVQKLLLIHDRIISNAAYRNADAVSNDDRTVVGVLLNKIGVSESYAKAFKYCADIIGIENEIVYSTTHTWNQVCLNGKWYNIDLASDDPVSTTTETDVFAQVKHGRFLVSDSKLSGTDYVTNATASAESGTEYDSFFWTKVNSSFIMADGVCLYADQYGKIYSYDFATETATQLAAVTKRWTNASGGLLAVRYVSLMYYNGYVYYNTPEEICTMRPDGSANSIIYTYNVDDKQIFGVGYKDGVPSYTVREEATAADKIIMISQATKILQAINVTTAPDKTAYRIGEKLDITGMVVTASYSDGSTFDLSSDDYEVSSFDSSAVGEKNLVVSYGSKTCLLTLKVIEVGDIDADYSVTAADLLALQQHILNTGTLTEQAASFADMDSDGVIDSVDMVMLQMSILGVN